MSRSFIFFSFLLLSIVLDQAIKIAVRTHMFLGQSLDIIKGFFRFTYIENRGIAFSFMEDNKIFLIVIPLVLIGILVYFYLTKRQEMDISFHMGIALSIGGGTSNLLDRIIFQSVTDYVDIGNFAIFNLADVFINIGVMLLCYNILFSRKEESVDRR